MAKTPFPSCGTKYLLAPGMKHSGVRTTSAIELIVIHTAEGCKTASCVGGYFCRPEVRASTHAAVSASGASCERFLPDLYVPWGARGANHDGWHLELCGFSRWTREEWLAHDRMLRNAAWRCALRAKWYKLPLRWVTVAELKAKPHIEGFTTHADVNKAFRLGDHHDPGPNFPRAVFMGYVRQYTKDYLTA